MVDLLLQNWSTVEPGSLHPFLLMDNGALLMIVRQDNELQQNISDTDDEMISSGSCVEFSFSLHSNWTLYSHYNKKEFSPDTALVFPSDTGQMRFLIVEEL